MPPESAIVRTGSGRPSWRAGRVANLALAVLVVASFPASAFGPASPDEAASTASSSTTIERLEAAMRREGFPGASIAVVRGTEIVFRAALGVTDRESGDPVTPETRFAIGSMGKPFTATAIMTLVEAGAIAPTDTLGRHLPEVPATYADVTIHQMLSHLSGIPRDFKRGHSLTGKKLFRAMAKSEPEFAPGSNFGYGNTNYVLLGEIVERLTGHPIDAFFREHYFEPLKMTRTVCISPGREIDDRATGHESETGPGASFLPARFGAGNILSTAEDVARWEIALTRGAVLSVEAQGRMWDPDGPNASWTEEGVTTSVGYGWFVRTLPDGRRIVEHTGSLDGFFGTLERHVDDGVAFVVLTNYERGDLNALVDVLADTFLPERSSGTPEAPASD